MEHENSSGPVMTYTDGQPLPDTPDFSLPAAKLETEKLATVITSAVAATERLIPAWEQMAETIRKIAHAISCEYEWVQAIRWAEVYNRSLANRYHHAKKKRIRKKYAKRILAWYREEVRGCYD